MCEQNAIASEEVRVVCNSLKVSADFLIFLLMQGEAKVIMTSFYFAADVLKGFGDLREYLERFLAL